jgi:hypothetical protein
MSWSSWGFLGRRSVGAPGRLPRRMVLPVRRCRLPSCLNPLTSLFFVSGVNVKRLADHPFFDDATSRELRRAMGLAGAIDWSEVAPKNWTAG